MTKLFPFVHGVAFSGRTQVGGVFWDLFPFPGESGVCIRPELKSIIGKNIKVSPN